MMPKCYLCQEPYPAKREELGYKTCLDCGGAAANAEKQRKARCPHQRVEWFGGTESENVIGLVAKYGGSIGGERIWQVLVNGEMWTIFEDYLVEMNDDSA
jgi:hypothetical protein